MLQLEKKLVLRYEINRENIDVGSYMVWGFEIDILPDAVEKMNYRFVLVTLNSNNTHT